MPLTHRFIPFAAACLPHVAFSQSGLPEEPESLAKQVLEVKAEMLSLISTHRTCLPQARMITQDSYVPFGVSDPRKLPHGGVPEVTKAFLVGGMLMAKNNILRGSVLVLCRDSIKIGEETLSPVFTIAAEDPSGYSVVHHFEYRLSQSGVTIKTEATQQALPLFFKAQESK